MTDKATIERIENGYVLELETDVWGDLDTIHRETRRWVFPDLKKVEKELHVFFIEKRFRAGE